jgi:hypothetical protein
MPNKRLLSDERGRFVVAVPVVDWPLCLRSCGVPDERRGLVVTIAVV